MPMGNDCNCLCLGGIGLGPWGCITETAKQWSFKAKKGDIKQIIIRYGGIIDSLIFKTHDGGYSSKFGGEGGDHTVKIDIDFPCEFLTGISGTYGRAGNFTNVICSLNFHTNITRYGPFGTQSGTPFSANIAEAGGGAVTGFHGCYGRYLEAIGIYVVPLCAISTEVRKEKHPGIIPTSTAPRFLLPPPSAAAVGGCGGRDWDDGVFAAVKRVDARVRVDTGVLSAVRFAYLKNDGSDVLTPFHGGDCDGGVVVKMIVFSEKDEYLIGIEGFHGGVDGSDVIRSLSFMTNKAKYGPLGAEMGTYFTSMNSGDCNRKLVGFHGRSSAYLDAIGLHTQYF